MPLPKSIRLWGLVLAVLLIGGCGYYFPHVYSGPHQTVLMPEWKNRTNKLDLDMKIYQSLTRWFQKSGKVSLIRQESGGDLLLTGEILSISLPSVSWRDISDVTGTKVNLVIRYTLKDQRTGKILIDVGGKSYTADYSEEKATIGNENAALAKIIEDLSEYIYLEVLNQIRKQQIQAGG